MKTTLFGFVLFLLSILSYFLFADFMVYLQQNHADLGAIIVVIPFISAIVIMFLGSFVIIIAGLVHAIKTARYATAFIFGSCVFLGLSVLAINNVTTLNSDGSVTLGKDAHHVYGEDKNGNVTVDGLTVQQ